MFTQIFKRNTTAQRHLNGPLLQERIMYLHYWADNGAAPLTLRRIATSLLVIINYLDLENRNFFTITQIKKAAEKWAKRPCNSSHKKKLIRS